MNIPTIFFWLLFCGAYVAFIWAVNTTGRILHRRNRDLAEVLIQKFHDRLASKRNEARAFCQTRLVRSPAKA